MSHSDPILTLPLDPEMVIAILTQCLQAEGLRVVRTFDLRSACASFPENVCPHHGSSPCNCQLVVLMVYGREPQPASLVIHGHVEQTEVELVQPPTCEIRPEFEASILKALSWETLLRHNDNPLSWSDVS
jgi:hypothetical protein